MQPARLRLAIVGPEPATLLPRLQAQLDRQGAPAITMSRHEDGLHFEADTADFMVRARVYAALERVCDHGEWQRRFRPLD